LFPSPYDSPAAFLRRLNDLVPERRGIAARIRALVRSSELWLVLVAAVVGAVAGLLVTIVSVTAQLMHQLLFGIGSETRLSGLSALEIPWLALVPALGGLCLGALALGIRSWGTPRRAVDPIEANALHGGQMSLGDSVLITVQTVISNGFGASVGLEAGYTQISSGVASRIGMLLRLRRGDLRVLVGCGAAGAIAGAFGFTLAGAFYAFELVIGTYTVATLAPVAAAAISGVLTAHALGAEGYAIRILSPPTALAPDFFALLVLGVVCAAIAIVVMYGVTFTESLFRKSPIPSTLHPAIGGVVLGGLALVSPTVLSAGHGALTLSLDMSMPPLALLAALLLLKVAGSAVSLGSGFRGGLFFASLYLGAVAGKLFAGLVAIALPSAAPDPFIAAIVGMSSMAVAIVGGPLTMSFLALEITGDLPVTVAVLAASLVSAVTVRETFGYSFATWRMHLRGETIRSAHDVGWIRALTVGRLMRRDVRTVKSDVTVAVLRRDFPLGSTQRIVVVDAADRYAGLVLTADLHAAANDADAATRKAADILRFPKAMLLPSLNVKQAMVMFDATESEALAVVDAPETGRVIGLLTEAYALRRYTEELDRAHRDVTAS
jgi:CIC family chloride channel protein